ncbi:glycosyltransferase [Methylovirgula sp. 4M-Z18]|nr:glycosyltransferase [Methylovirgula sp. 4M-Z18]
MRAAEALKATAALHYPHADVLHLDVMAYVNTAFRKVYADLYLQIVTKHPTLWGMLYQVSDEAAPDGPSQRMRRAIERLSTRKLRIAIDDYAPDSVICTHFLPAELLMREIARSRFSVPVFVQVTDFDLHRMWVVSEMAGFFAGNDEVAFRMRAQHIPPERIHVTGIPVMPAFTQPHVRAECARQFGLAPERRTYLLMGGGAGLGVAPLAKRLLETDPDLQLVVLTGKNAQALAELKQLAARRAEPNLFPLGFTDEVAKLMACADLVVSKPGGLTTSECLAMGVPMLVTAPIPGQEERNADYLLEHGAALKAVDDLALEYRVQYLRRRPQMLMNMRERAKELGRPQAAHDALKLVFQHLAGK